MFFQKFYESQPITDLRLFLLSSFVFFEAKPGKSFRAWDPGSPSTPATPQAHFIAGAGLCQRQAAAAGALTGSTHQARLI